MTGAVLRGAVGAWGYGRHAADRLEVGFDDAFERDAYGHGGPTGAGAGVFGPYGFGDLRGRGSSPCWGMHRVLTAGYGAALPNGAGCGCAAARDPDRDA